MKCTLAGLMFVVAGFSSTGPALASFTASFQPCELPRRDTGKGNVLARCEVEFAGKPASVELIGNAPNQVSEAVFRPVDGSGIHRLLMDVRPFIDPENVSIIVRDMNFDGWPDFGVRDFSIDGSNIAWSFWLWSETDGDFEFHEQLSSLPNPEVSPRLRAVRSFVETAPDKVRTDVYQWLGARLVLRSSTFD